MELQGEKIVLVFEMIIEVLALVLILGAYLLIVLKNKKKGEPLFPVDSKERYDKMMEPFMDVAIIVSLIMLIYAYFTGQL